MHYFDVVIYLTRHELKGGPAASGLPDQPTHRSQGVHFEIFKVLLLGIMMSWLWTSTKN